MFMKTVILRRKKVVFAIPFFYENLVFADKYVIIAVTTLPPLMGIFF